MIRFFCALLLALAAASPVAAQQASWNLTDGARVHPDYNGPVPKKSDVIFSTRFKRAEAPEVIKAFGATRVEWVYSTDKDYIEKLKSTAGWFGGTLNANVSLPNDDGIARDFDGNPLVAPWMKGWGAKWVTTTHPDTVKALKEEAAKIVGSGADSIQVDDPLLQLHSALWGGDFNKATLQGFNRYLSTYPDKKALTALGLAELGDSDYRDLLRSQHGVRNTKDYVARYRSFPTTEIWIRYLRTSVRQHFEDFRAHLNMLRGRSFPISMNLGGLDKPNETGWHFFLAEFADYIIGETPITSLPDLVSRAATARALGLGYVPSLMPRTAAENRVAIATLYALGSLPLVPWDMYEGNDEKGQPKRFFGAPDDYGPLYGFVRAHPELFNGTETAAVVGIPIPVSRFRNEETTRTVRTLVEKQIPFAFLLVGGTERQFKLEIARARHVKMLITVNPEGDFHPDDLKVIRAIPIPQTESNRLTDDTLRNLAPLSVVGGLGAVKIYPRVAPSSRGHRLVVHVVDEARGHMPLGDRNCERRIAIKKSAISGQSIVRATWYGGRVPKSVTFSASEREVSAFIGECEFWGILLVDLQ
jgi:hypothetical protein